MFLLGTWQVILAHQLCGSGHTGKVGLEYFPGNAGSPGISPESPLGTHGWEKVLLTG